MGKGEEAENRKKNSWEAVGPELRPLVMAGEGLEAFPALRSHTGGQTAGSFPRGIRHW